MYLSSIVALEGSTGVYRWHYQTTPADNWDYTATQHMILADLTIDGLSRQVIMQAPKNGFFYVLDRLTGELLSAEPYVPVNWASEINAETGRLIETDIASYRDKDQIVRPAPFGAHNWQPMAWNPKTGLVYIPAMQNLSLYSHPADYSHLPGPHWNTGQNDGAVQDNPLASLDPIYAAPLLKHLMRGQLIAWDPQRGRAAWRQSCRVCGMAACLRPHQDWCFRARGPENLLPLRHRAASDFGQPMLRVE